MTTTQNEVFPLQAGWRRGDSQDSLLSREWLVTNALGGYASGTIGGASTRRFHGALIAAMPAPLGRAMMLNHLEESLVAGELCYRLSGEEGAEEKIRYPEEDFLEEFVLEQGLPVWRYAKNGIRIEKRVVMPHLQNTTWVTYTMTEGPEDARLELRPAIKFRPHEGTLTTELPKTWSVKTDRNEIEISDGTGHPPLRLMLLGEGTAFRSDPKVISHFVYRIERSRGYDYEGELWCPGVITLPLRPGVTYGFAASAEEWDVVRALEASESFDAERGRRQKLLSMSGREGDEPFSAQLVLAADQFLIRPQTRSKDQARAFAAGDEPRTVIAGYHWFTDWGRDTMISLEGLTLVTGRHREAGNILRTFASYIRDGLIPNMFPEGEHEGLYHTADATLWFFHAVNRYYECTGDRVTLRELLPKLVDIVDHHVKGTRFDIHVDPADGLLTQGKEGYQLTWMDAKVDDWVVTPRRGKAVEINALFYNALRILEQFLRSEQSDEAERIGAIANRAFESFNQRFWFEDGQYLYDIVDAEGGGNDPALRPNQVFAIALDYPVLDRNRWDRVLDVVQKELLTPVGLRSLARAHPDYKPAYDGNLRARDAAYHQGTVWGWLIGPFIDAWLKVHSDDRAGALALVEGFRPHMADACIGSISEVFDAEAPFTARGCVAQAWSVAEVLRCLRKLR
jgi:predicted glycogen debranching enzyme